MRFSVLWIVLSSLFLTTTSTSAQDREPATPQAQPATRQRAPEADPDPHRQRVEWQDQWSAVHWAEYPLVVAMVTVPYWGNFIITPATEASLRGGILIDEPIREALYLETADGRFNADAVSDVLWPIVQHYSLIDIFFVVPVLHGEPGLAWKMMWIQAEAMGLAAIVTWPIARVSGRERPIGADCDRDPSYSPDCETENRWHSFYSGHVATAVTGAGLTCVHHQNLPIYGHGWANRLPCLASIGGAAAIGVLRIMADKHYITDVLTGAVVGFGAGYLWPSLVRYTGDAEDYAATHAAVVPWGSPTSIGVAVIGQSM